MGGGGRYRRGGCIRGRERRRGRKGGEGRGEGEIYERGEGGASPGADRNISRTSLALIFFSVSKVIADLT